MTAGSITDGWAWLQERWQRLLAWIEGVPWPRWVAQRAHHDELKAASAQTAALAAVPDPTDEQRIGLMQQEQGYLLQIANLKRLEEENGKLTREQIGQMATLQRTVQQIRLARDGATPETVGPQRMALFGPIGGVVGAAAGGWQIWAIGGAAVVAALGYHAIEVNTLRMQRDAPCSDRELADERTRRAACTQAAQWEMQASAFSQALADRDKKLTQARAAAAEAARAIQAERTRTAARREREQRRVRAIQDVLTSGDAPPWSLRDDTPTDAPNSTPAAPATTGDRAGVSH